MIFGEMHKASQDVAILRSELAGIRRHIACCLTGIDDPNVIDKDGLKQKIRDNLKRMAEIVGE